MRVYDGIGVPMENMTPGSFRTLKHVEICLLVSLAALKVYAGTHCDPLLDTFKHHSAAYGHTRM